MKLPGTPFLQPLSTYICRAAGAGAVTLFVPQLSPSSLPRIRDSPSSVACDIAVDDGGVGVGVADLENGWVGRSSAMRSSSRCGGKAVTEGVRRSRRFCLRRLRASMTVGVGGRCHRCWGLLWEGAQTNFIYFRAKNEFHKTCLTLLPSTNHHR